MRDHHLASISKGPDDGPQAWRARWVVTPGQPPLAEATIVVHAGQIVEIHQQHDPRATDLGPVALLPGLVNTHTHLEFSDFTTPVGDERVFPEWIRTVVRERRERGGTTHHTIRAGLEESQRGGATTLGEIATANWCHEAALSACWPGGVVFREILGLDPARQPQLLETAEAFLSLAADVAARLPPHFVSGLSPHAPYSVHPQLYYGLLALAQQHAAPVAVHLAESREELELLRHGTGPFRTLLEQIGAWQDGVFGKRSCRDYLEPLDRITRGLVVHGNFLTGDDLAWLSQRERLTLIYCPRTHHRFGHPPHPWQQLLAMGGRVALGTDSRASNPDLSMWRELQFVAQQYPSVPPLDVLALGTRAGAAALGLEGRCGRIAVGCYANLLAVQLSDVSETGITRHLLASDSKPVGCWQRGVRTWF